MGKKLNKRIPAVLIASTLATSMLYVVPAVSAHAEGLRKAQVTSQSKVENGNYNANMKTSTYGVGEGIQWPSQVFAPYVDATAWTSGPMSDGGSLNLVKVYQKTGVKFFNLGFIQSTGAPSPKGSNELSWGWGGFGVLSPSDPGNTQYQGILDSIKGIRQVGGDVSVSFGGAGGLAFWQATQNVDTLYNTYKSIVQGYGLKNIDLDIEGSATDVQDNIANAQAIKKLQDETGVNVSLTLGVLPSGMTPVQLNVLKAYLQAGVKVNLINLMTMCYPQDTLLPGENYGTASLSAVTDSMNQIKEYYKEYANTNLTDAEAYKKIGVTPSIAFESTNYPIFTLNWAKELLDFCEAKGVGRVSMWDMNRDAMTVANKGITTPYQYADLFGTFGKGVVIPPASSTTGSSSTAGSSSSNNGISTWNSTEAYVGGTVVMYNGKEYKAKWWTQGDTPGNSQVWEEINNTTPVNPSNKTPDKSNSGQTPVNPTNKTPDKNNNGQTPTKPTTVTPNKNDNGSGNSSIKVYNSNQIYVAGDTVTYNGKEYKAKWWTKGDIPGQSAVWELVSKTTEPQNWVEGMVCTQGQKAIYKGKEYEANWWTTSAPGSDAAWKLVETTK